MIRYALECRDCEAGFEGWFASSDAFETQRDRHLITCPNCGGADVRKSTALSASSGRDRPPGGTRAHARGTGVVGRPRWASVRQWSRGSTAAALQQAARRGPAQHQPLRVRNRKGWVESGHGGPVWGPLPPRQQPSPARGAMASSQRPHLRAVRVTSLTPRLRTSAGAALT